MNKCNIRGNVKFSGAQVDDIFTKEDDGSIHCMGNGNLAAYAQGPDIIQIFGPPYSSPSSIQLNLINENFDILSQRESGAAIWKHIISNSGRKICEILDFVDSEIPCMVRQMNNLEPVEFALQIRENVHVIENTTRFSKWNTKTGLLVTAEAGTFIYGHYPSPVRLYNQVIIIGDTNILTGDSENSRRIICEKGECRFYFIGGSTYPECMDFSEEVLAEGYDELLERTRQWWKSFTENRYDFEKILPQDTPCRGDLIKTIDDIAILIKVQQSSQGAVLAGHNYHLGYVRDQYGVSRCLLKLGYFKEAKSILDFYWGIWRKYGKLHNAQAAGVDGVFHIHENDDVEITGYLIIQAFDYLYASKDEEFFKEMLPMLEWTWEAQKKHLVGHMIPFNGDETYVAGGVLPRNTLNDGSSEATLLFITAGERLLQWINQNDIWDMQKLAENIRVLESTMNKYRENFWDGHGIIANNPDRVLQMQLPWYRHGVCEACFEFGWTEKNSNNRYLCPKCLNSKDMDSAESIRYKLQSVSLVPLFIGSSLFSKEEIWMMVDGIVSQYKRTGKLPSRLDDDVTVGYDYGLLLYNLTELGHTSAQEIYEKTLGILDQTGAWVEYYENGKPKGTRCRPWESGINLEAIINYVIKRHHKPDTIQDF